MSSCPQRAAGLACIRLVFHKQYNQEGLEDLWGWFILQAGPFLEGAGYSNNNSNDESSQRLDRDRGSPRFHYKVYNWVFWVW